MALSGKKWGTAALIGVAVTAAATAKEWTVPSPADGNEAAVAALTNALANCAEKDVVTLARGVYDLAGVVSHTDEASGPSHLSVGRKTITLRGDPSATREDVVLQGDGARILRFEKAACWIENMTLSNGCAQAGQGGAIFVSHEGIGMGDFCYLTNCVLRCNTSNGANGAGGVAGATLYGCLAESNAAPKGCAGVLRYGRAYDTVFRNNQAKEGGACYQVTLVGCTLEGNVATTGSGGAAAYNSQATNCTFRHNAAAYGGALERGRALVGCVFVGNEAVGNGGALYGQKGTVENCRFESNWVRKGGAQGAINGDADAAVVVRDCLFTNNAAGWSGGVGTGVAVWSNCLFVCNAMRSDGGSTAGTVGGTYYGCTFRGQWSTTAAYQVAPTNDIPQLNDWKAMTAVMRGTLFDCTIEGCVRTSALTRCTLVGTTNAPLVVAAGCALTNCLVVGNRLARDRWDTPLGVFYAASGETPPSLVNCTVVDNQGTLFKAAGGAAVNTLFFGNTTADGAAADLSGGGTATAPLALDHCLYQTCASAPEDVAFSDCVPLAPGEDPRFNAGRAADYPWYMPRAASKAVDAGAARAWDADATDRGGFPRVAGAAVDIGCYESCLPWAGFQLLVR